MGGSSPTVGYNYRLVWFDGLALGPWDALTEFRGADKRAWKGRVEANTAIPVYEPNLWGGDKDQGGVDGTLTPMFGQADQAPHPYLVSVFGPKISAHRGMMNAVWVGIWGANNPFQQKRSYRGERTYAGWDNDDCWYPETVRVPIEGDFSPGTPSVGTYRWAFKMGGVPSLSPSPDGIDWTDSSTIPAAFYTAEVTLLVGETLVSINAGGSTRFANWTTPGAWIDGPAAGAVSGLLNPYVCVIAGRTFVARGTAGYSISDNVTVSYQQFAGSTTLFLGNADFVVRCRGGAAPTFFSSADTGETFEERMTIERSFDPDDADYAFDIYAGAASDSAYAVGGRDYHGKPVIFRSVDGFGTSIRVALPPELLGTIYELFYRPGLGWLAFMNNSSGGFGALLRSTDDAQTFQVVDLGTPVNFGQTYQGNCAFDTRDGRVVIAAQTPEGGRIFQTDDYEIWFEREYVAAFGPATILCIAPYDPGTPPVYGRIAKNPAHMILWAHTQQHCGRQARESVDLDQLTVQADWFYERGFGLCWVRNPKEESPREFIKRIERVAGCSFTLSLDDGLWHLDVANGVYDLGALPVITDNDVVSFKETATTLDNAVNSVSIKYFDPELNESIITPPLRAMGLIAQFGEIHQTFEYPEVPIARIALEIRERELLARTTPTRGFELVCRPTIYRLRKNQYVRLQLPKRGIADMVCLVGEIPTSGKLKSGNFEVTLTQDIYSLPSTVYGGIELGEDNRPPTTPADLEFERAFEAPYIDVVANMPASELASLPDDAGYVLGAAVDPGRMRDFTMMVAPEGGSYDEVGDGQFCPSCTSTGLVEPGLQEGIGYENDSRMASVEVGDVGEWDGELIRVDAVDLDAKTLDLGRGCGDTIPRQHLAGSRILFYQRTAAFDRTQHVAGETLEVKLLTNSWSKRQPLADAEALSVPMDQRLQRPYPQANMKINGVSIFAVGTATPGGGGGGGGGGGSPSLPPAIGANGAPTSTQTGPNGAYPDDGPPLFPYPDVFDEDIIEGGDFEDPADLARWRTQTGMALGPEWDLLEGALHVYAGHGTHSAYCFGARKSVPYMPFPRYAITVSIDVACDPNVVAEVGLGWGTYTNGHLPIYAETSEPNTYPATTTVTKDHTFIVTNAGQGQGVFGQYSVINFMPMVRFTINGAPANGKADNATLVIAEVPVDTTPETPANSNFESGLTGWTLWPDPTNASEHSCIVTAVGGVLSMEFVSVYGPFRYAICEAPLTLADMAGKYAKSAFEGWCDEDETVTTNTGGPYPAGGVTSGLAYKPVAGDYQPVAGGRLERGDFTPREVWQRIAKATAEGYTVHRCLLGQGRPGTTCKWRNLADEITDEVID